MVEGLKLYSEIEQLKQKLKLIENPLLRYVYFCYSQLVSIFSNQLSYWEVTGLFGFFKICIWLSEEF